MHKWYKIYFCCLYLFVFGYCQTYANQTTITDLIKVAKSHEKSNTVISWKCQRKQGTYKDLNDLTAITHSIQSENYEVIFDISRQKYNVHGYACRPWFDGKADYVSTEVGFSFDGKKYICWKRSKPGKTKPSDKDYGEGQVSYDLSDIDQDVSIYSQTNGVYQGIGSGIPGFVTMHTYDSYGAKKISAVFQQWEKEKRIASINENPDTKKFEIEARIDRVQGTDDFFLKILYDPVTNTVEHGELFSRFKGVQYVMTIYDIEFQENENGIKFPKFVKEIYPLDHRIILSSYSSLKINPSLTENTFQVIIPDGINVSDYVLKQFYKVGDLLDEDKAIDAFIVRHGLTGNVPKTTTAGGVVRYVLIVVGCLMILASIVLYFRKRMQA